MNEKWFSMSIGDIEKKLKTNAASGLTRKAARSAWYRDNASDKNKHTLFIRKNKPIGRMIGEIFADFALVILLLAAVFAVFLEDGQIGATVLGILSIGLIVSFVVYFISQRAMEQMDLYFLPSAKVIRGGKLYRVSFDNVVAGDVIILERGDIVPADARLVTSDKLSVSMRVDTDSYVSLQKQAQGVIAQNENNPAQMINILHAGSVIEKGSARAIVYATGIYTYLGARTGGISVLYSDNIPRELKKMKKICSQINLFSMICILPFCIISVFLSYINSGNSTLSVAFLTALALSASSMTQFSTTVCKIFFIKKIRDISLDKNRAIIRTTEAFDDLCDIKYLFMLDGSAVTDGVLHFDTAFTLDGELKNYENSKKTNELFFEAAALYNYSQSNALSLGLNNIPDRFKVGIDEFINKSSVNVEILKMKYNINAYVPSTMSQPIDRVYYSDSDIKKVIDVSRTSDVFSKCSYAFVGGRVQPLNAVGLDKLIHMYNFHTEKGKTVLVFTVSNQNNNILDSGKLFLGALVLREGIDKYAFSAISTLEKRGIKVISFSGKYSDMYSPQIPMELHGKKCAYKSDFEKNQLPLTYKFGDFDTYYGFNATDIESLVDFAHSNNVSVGVISFSDFAPNVIEKSDVFISCSQVLNLLAAKTEQELYTLEMAGAASSSSCIQTVKSESDVLIPRPNGKCGGISSLVNLLAVAKVSYENLNRFFKYMISVQLLRLITAGVPMLFGKTTLNATHILFCSFIFDLFVMLMFALNSRAISQNNISQYKIKSLKIHLKKHRRLLICVFGVGMFSIIFPEIIGFTGIFGHYLYKTEYLFCTVLWLHLVVAYYMRYSTIKNIQQLTKDKFFIALILFVCVFIIALFIVNPLGLLFEFIANPLPYFIASFIPAVMFIALMEFLPAFKQAK